MGVPHHAAASYGCHRLTPLARLRNFPIIVMAAIETRRAAGVRDALRLRRMNAIRRRRDADTPITVEETA